MADDYTDFRHGTFNKSGAAQRAIAHPRILEVIDKSGTSLVVMGSQGRTGLDHLMLGSKAEQVVRLSPVPVMIVKASPDDEERGHR